MADSTNQPVVNDVSAPTIEKHTTMMATDADATQQQPQPDSLVSNSGTTITPDASAAAPAADPVPDKPAEEAPPQAVEQNAKVTTPPTETVATASPASPYEASDSLPDMSQKLTTEMTDDMQSPRIYDTKEYVVPIHDTMHSHGAMGKIIAAVVSVTVMLAIVIAVAYAVI